MLLTRWTYSPEEWKRFLHWKRRKRGMIFVWFRKLLPGRLREVPEVRIGVDRVWLNKTHQPFQDQHRAFQEVEIREAGQLNIMEIRYTQGNVIRGIELPIPKGKLKEAFEVQEKLKTDH